MKRPGPFQFMAVWKYEKATRYNGRHDNGARVTEMFLCLDAGAQYRRRFVCPERTLVREHVCVQVRSSLERRFARNRKGREDLARLFCVFGYVVMCCFWYLYWKTVCVCMRVCICLGMRERCVSSRSFRYRQIVSLVVTIVLTICETQIRNPFGECYEN